MSVYENPFSGYLKFPSIRSCVKSYLTDKVKALNMHMLTHFFDIIIFINRSMQVSQTP